MGVVTYEMEITSSLPPAKLFKAFVLETDKLMPKVMPQAIKNVEILEGNGGPGTIKQITLGEGSTYKYAKHKVDSIDKENFTYGYSIIEGDALGTKIESICNEIKILPAADGGSVCKNISKYHTKGDCQLSEDEIKSGKEKASHMFKAIESYILANPGAC